MMLIAAFIMTFMLKEPIIERKDKQRSLSGQSKQLVQLTFKAFKNDRNLTLGLIFTVLLASDSLVLHFIQDFISSFYDKNLDQHEKLQFIEKFSTDQSTFGLVLTIIMLFPIGLLTDYMSPKILIPLCLAIRSANLFAIYQVKNIEEQYHLALYSLSFSHATEKLVVVSL